MSAITKDGIEVKVGQVWRDLDKRMRGRTITVERVENGFAYSRTEFTRPTRLSIRRMHRHSTGWELVK